MNYLIYFLGPVILAAAGVRFLRQRWSVFFIGLAAFFCAWVVDQMIAAVASKGFHVAQGSVALAVIISVSAGVFEESARYIAFRWSPALKGNSSWNSSTMYSIGHSGMESVIVGATLLLTLWVVNYMPSAITDPAVLEQARATVGRGFSASLYDANERLFIGLLTHSLFSAVVMLGVIRSNIRYLFLAITLHFVHDVIGLNLHLLSDHWAVSMAWIGIIIVMYSYVLFQLRRVMSAPHAHGQT